jgi:hypothetical protein
VEIGQRVEVRNSFNNSWAPGFEIAKVEPGGFRVRRSSDGELLSNVTSEADLRTVK